MGYIGCSEDAAPTMVTLVGEALHFVVGAASSLHPIYNDANINYADSFVNRHN